MPHEEHPLGWLFVCVIQEDDPEDTVTEITVAETESGMRDFAAMVQSHQIHPLTDNVEIMLRYRSAGYFSFALVHLVDKFGPLSRIEQGLYRARRPFPYSSATARN